VGEFSLSLSLSLSFSLSLSLSLEQLEFSFECPALKQGKRKESGKLSARSERATTRLRSSSRESTALLLESAISFRPCSLAGKEGNSRDVSYSAVNKDRNLPR
jgi:hypothetical protein